MLANNNAMTRYKILDDILNNRYQNFYLDDLTEEVDLLLKYTQIPMALSEEP